jgi:hypothetical protein
MMRLLAPLALLIAPPALAQEVYGPPDEPTPLFAPIEHPAPERIKPDARWKAWEYAFLVGSAVDTIDTAICRSRDTCIERSPLYGRTPAWEKVVALKVGTSAAHYLIVREIAKRDPKVARIAAMVSAVVQGGVLVFNFRKEF